MFENKSARPPAMTMSKIPGDDSVFGSVIANLVMVQGLSRNGQSMSATLLQPPNVLRVSHLAPEQLPISEQL